MIDATVDQLAKIIWDFNRPEVVLKPADCIVVLGSNDVRVAQRGAELLLQGYAPLIIFSGNVGRLTKGLWDRPEAEVFAAAARQMGVPEEQILIENKSRHTGENLVFTKQLLKDKGLTPKSFIVVQKPYMYWRVWGTFKKVFPDTDFVVTAPDISYAAYPNEFVTKDHMLNVMVGDIQRLPIYARKGYSAPVVIPAPVWQAYEQLVALDYTKHLVAEE